MRRHNKYLTFLAAVLLSAISSAGVYNGSFEQVEPNEWLNFDPPTGWERENYTAVLEQYIPWPPPREEGNMGDWKIDIQAGLKPVHGNSLVLLSTGDIDPNPYGASIRQPVYAYADQKISGHFFFGTCDYEPYNDHATITLIAESNSASDIILVSVDVNDVGDYGSMYGWETFEHVFSEVEAGPYQLVIAVEDEQDNRFPSYLAVDAVSMCTPPIAEGDINLDCYVNFEDFSLLAYDWLHNCNDPNYLADPNNNCSFGTDIDNDGPVEANDLMFMSNTWLDGQ